MEMEPIQAVQIMLTANKEFPVCNVGVDFALCLGVGFAFTGAGASTNDVEARSKEQ